MKKEITPSQALQKAEALCAFREMCAHDIVEKLKRWGIAPREQEEIIDTLVEQRFIDEERYAKSFVHDKFRFDHWGRIKIRYALRMKQLATPAIEEALATIDDEQYNTSLAEMLVNKQRSTKAKSPQEHYAKLYRFAASRGFESDIIAKQLNRLDLCDQ